MAEMLSGNYLLMMNICNQNPDADVADDQVEIVDTEGWGIHNSAATARHIYVC